MSKPNEILDDLVMANGAELMHERLTHPSVKEALQALHAATIAVLPEPPGVNKGTTDPLECKLEGYALAIKDVTKAINKLYGLDK